MAVSAQRWRWRIVHKRGWRHRWRTKTEESATDGNFDHQLVDIRWCATSAAAAVVVAATAAWMIHQWCAAQRREKQQREICWLVLICCIQFGRRRRRRRSTDCLFICLFVCSTMSKEDCLPPPPLVALTSFSSILIFHRSLTQYTSFTDISADTATHRSCLTRCSLCCLLILVKSALRDLLFPMLLCACWNPASFARTLTLPALLHSTPLLAPIDYLVVVVVVVVPDFGLDVVFWPEHKRSSSSSAIVCCRFIGSSILFQHLRFIILHCQTSTGGTQKGKPRRRRRWS